jgi:hypothetical protein
MRPAPLHLGMLMNLSVLTGAGAMHLHGGSAYVRAFKRPSGPPGWSASDEVGLVDVSVDVAGGA